MYIYVYLISFESYLITGDISKLIDGHILVEVGSEDDALAVAGRLQNPDLFLLQGLSVCVGPEAERFCAQVLVFGVNEADGPTALVRSRCGSIGGVCGCSVESGGQATGAVAIAHAIQTGHGGD